MYWFIVSAFFAGYVTSGIIMVLAISYEEIKRKRN